MFDECSDRIQCSRICILNDDCLENYTEYFHVSISSTFDCVSFINDSAEVAIIDDDCE